MDRNDVLKDSICILPFLHLFVRTDGLVAPCCISDGWDISVNEGDIDDVINHPKFLELRKQMLDGEKPKVCDICFKNGHGMRNDFNNLWERITGKSYVDLSQELVDEDYKISKLKSTDLRFSNLCNFSCRMCAPIYSTNWYEDAKIVYPNHVVNMDNKSIKIGDNFVQKLDKHTNNLNWVYLAGGEPLIMDETFQYLEQLLPNAKECEIVINTNLSNLMYKKIDILDLLSNFKNCHMVVSCDGYGEMGEYIRTGFSHEKFFTNVRKLRDLSKTKYHSINFSFNFTISIFNVFHIFDFIDYIKQEDLFSDNLMTQWVTYPYHLSVGNTSEEFKDKVRNFITDNIKKNPTLTQKIKEDLNNFINYLNVFEPTRTEHNTLDFVKKLDVLRNSDFRNTSPWIENEIKSI